MSSVENKYTEPVQEVRTVTELTVRDNICRQFRRQIPCVDWCTRRAHSGASASEGHLRIHDELAQRGHPAAANDKRTSHVYTQQN